jgi:hypothetical protein
MGRSDPKWGRWLVWPAVIALLPAMVGTGLALGKVIAISTAAESAWIVLISGALCWLIVFWLLPRPMWIYVFGHELSHALWAWTFGARVKRIRVRASGGHVVLTKSNILITLAPYFFPFHLLVLLSLFGLGNWLWDWRSGLVWLHFAIGAGYAFHASFTCHTLRHGQPDLEVYGVLPSLFIILLANLVVLVLGLPLVTGLPRLSQAWGWWLEDSARAYSWSWQTMVSVFGSRL